MQIEMTLPPGFSLYNRINNTTQHSGALGAPVQSNAVQTITHQPTLMGNVLIWWIESELYTLIYHKLSSTILNSILELNWMFRRFSMLAGFFLKPGYSS